jgi:hypothetical protein
MEVRHFNDIAGTGFGVRRYLFLIIVPAEAEHYIFADPLALQLRHCGFWASLVDRELIDERKQQKTTVHVPKQNMLTVPALQGLMSSVPVQRVGP